MTFFPLLILWGMGSLSAGEFNNFKVIDHAKWEGSHLQHGEEQEGEEGRRIASLGANPLDSLGRGYGPIYQKIESYFKKQYEKIREEQLRSTNNGEDLSVKGSLNRVGLNYRKDFGRFNVDFQRLISPDLLKKDRFIVRDIMNIQIDAVKLLGEMKTARVIEISEKQMQAFMGLFFRRSYEYIHHADSYVKALTLKMDHLFFSFLRFRSQHFLKLGPYEVMSREDDFGLYAGEDVNLPMGGGNFALRSSGAMRRHRSGEVKVHALGEGEQVYSNEKLRMSFKQSRKLEIDFRADVLADFFNLVKVQLMGVSLTQNRQKSYTLNLSFDEQALGGLGSGGPLAKEVDQILKNRDFDLSVLSPYVVSELRREKDSWKSKYSFSLSPVCQEKRIRNTLK